MIITLKTKTTSLIKEREMWNYEPLAMFERVMFEFQCSVEINDERFTCDAREIIMLEEIYFLGLYIILYLLSCFIDKPNFLCMRERETFT